MKLPTLKQKIPPGLFQAVYGLPGWQKAAILLFACCLPLVLFWFFFLSPRLGELDGLKGRIPQLQSEMERLRKKAKELPELEKELNAMEGILSKAVRLLPEQKDIPAVLTEISSLGNQARLEFLSFRPGNETPKGFYAAIPVDMELKGSFNNTVSFFDRVGRMARIVHIGEVTMGEAKQSSEVWSQRGGEVPSSEGRAGDRAADTESTEAEGEKGLERGGSWVVKTRCQAIAYRFLDLEEQKAVAAQEGKAKQGARRK